MLKTKRDEGNKICEKVTHVEDRQRRSNLGIIEILEGKKKTKQGKRTNIKNDHSRKLLWN